MAYYFQVTVDSAQGYATDTDTKHHNGVLVWRDGAAILAPGEPASPSRRRVLFQLVPEPKTVKNRVHLDVRVGADNIETVLEEVQARGGTFVHRASQGPHSWVTVADPEGNEFCIT